MWSGGVREDIPGIQEAVSEKDFSSLEVITTVMQRERERERELKIKLHNRK